MPPIRPLARALAATGLLALSLAPGQAHDLWLTPAPGGVAVHLGHVHEPTPPSADKLVHLGALTARGTATLTARAEAGAPVLTAAVAGPGDALVSATYDSGFWVRTRAGAWRNADRRAVPDAERSQWSMKFAKVVLGPEAPWDRVLGQTLEIVPLEAPTRAAEAVRVRVLFEGRPVAGAEIAVTSGEAADPLRVATGADGEARVPLARAGQQILAVGHRVKPSRTPALADADSYTATLAFTVAEPRTN